MEDQHAVYQLREKDFFSAEIYDGHGGKRAAQIAAESLTSTFLHVWASDLEKPQVARRSQAECLREAYGQADKNIIDSGTESGTTAATFYIIDGRFVAANVGDSRVIIGTKWGRCRALTVDHRPSLEDEKSRIEDLGGIITWFGTPRVQGVLAVSRSLGDANLKPFISSEPRITEGYLGKENDYVVLACDGVWDVLSPEEVMSAVRAAKEPQPAAEKIKEMALDSGSKDNISVIVVDLRGYVMAAKQKSMKLMAVTDHSS